MSEERIKRLEKTVKHLVQFELDRQEYGSHDSKMSMEEYLKREQEHKEIFKNFLTHDDMEIVKKNDPRTD